MRLTLASLQVKSINFDLEPGSRLVHVAFRTVSNTGPIRCLLTISQPRAGPDLIIMPILNGWIRGFSVQPFGSSHLVWHGDLEVDTDMRLIFTARNDTGAVANVSCQFMVIE